LIDTVSIVPRRLGLLVVDDDVLIRTLLHVALRRQGLAMWMAADGAEASKLYRQHRVRIDLVLLDVNMPGLDGPQTLQLLRAENPSLRACLMSGARDHSSEAELSALGVARFFAKPFQVSDLLQELQQLAAVEAPPAADPLALRVDAAIPPGAERRIGVRYLSHQQGLCQPVGPARTAELWLGRLRDISVSGIRLLLDRRFEVGTLLTLDLPGSNGSAHRLLARVVRLTSGNDGHWELGCHFTYIIREDELCALVLRPSESR
jgi:CheY-like chemotaxis protein